MSEKPFDEDFWESKFGSSNLDPTVSTEDARLETIPSGLGLVFGTTVTPIDTDTLTRAAALIRGRIRATLEETAGNPIVAAGMVARQEESAKRVAAMIMAHKLGAAQWGTMEDYNADLDAATAYTEAEVAPLLFERRDLDIRILNGYAQVLMIGFQLGRFLDAHPLVG